jgi:hypothetical protein
MKAFEFFFEYSLLWIIPCLFIAVGYAYVLYSGKAPWSKSVNRTLFGLRATVVFILLLLLLEPLVQLFQRSYSNPTIVFAIDNSESIALADSTYPAAVKKKVQNLSAELERKGYNVAVESFSGAVEGIDSIPFDVKGSDINTLLNAVKNKYTNRQLKSVYFISDGILNQGISPAFTDYAIQINTLAVGDTAVKKDLKIRDVRHNKTVKVNNRFPLRVEWEARQLAGKSFEITISEEGKVLEQKKMTVRDDQFISNTEFTLEAKTKGMHHYVVELKGNGLEEIRTNNNVAHLYIKAIERTKKIVLLASAPHPDIKAIRNVIESYDEYDFHTRILSVDEKPIEPKVEQEALVTIFHQIYRNDWNHPWVSGMQKSDASKLYCVGSMAQTIPPDNILKSMRFSRRGTQVDEVKPAYNRQFSKFTYEADQLNLYQQTKPIKVPFLQVAKSPATETIVYQKVGSVTTEKPMISYWQNGEEKEGVMMGDGYWNWRIQALREDNSAKRFDDLFGKYISLLAQKERKSRFLFYPLKDKFSTDEQPRFQANIYNAIYEEVYGQTIELRIRNEKDSSINYSFTHTRGIEYKTAPLKEGVYTYTAWVSLDDKKFKESGVFTVRESKIESYNLQANFNLMNTIAARNNGQAFELTRMTNDNLPADAKQIISTRQNIVSAVNFKLLFYFVIFLAVIEWGARKYLGYY